MRQRALTAMAVANGPALLIADEPTTALDARCRQILRLMRDLNEQSARHPADHPQHRGGGEPVRRLIVMYAGRVVEDGRRTKSCPHRSTPIPGRCCNRCRASIAHRPLDRDKGQPPDPAMPLGGCKFHPPMSVGRTALHRRGAIAGTGRPSHAARCWVRMRT